MKDAWTVAKLGSGYWQDLTTVDFAGLDPATCIALLPVGATEQHGPHLPLKTDSCINDGIVRRTLEILPAEASVLVLPRQAVGESTEHGGFPGTLSLAPETAIRAWTDIGRCVHAAGLRKLVFFNSHGGQPQIVSIAAQRLRLEQGMLVVMTNSYKLGLPEGLFETDELRHGIHGGAVETSILLHLSPETVRRDKLANFPSLSQEMAQDYRHLNPLGPASIAWATRDLNLQGACGDPRQASAEKGRLIVDHAAAALAEILAETARFPLDKLRSPA